VNTAIWDWGFALSILPNLIAATAYTVMVTIVSFAGALLLGWPIALARESRRGWIRHPASWIVEFVRSTPLLIQIYVLYFALPAVGIVLSAIMTGLIALSIHYATYVSEAYRAGLASVPRTQWEAAKALGLRPLSIYAMVVAPQALVPIVPVLGNYLIALFKETPLLSAVAIIELLQTAKLIGSETFRYTEPITIVGLIFLALSLGSAAVIRWIERHLSKWR
jgi:polar amino acid transport system permease protein